jgi:single-strand DNA-binding protein
MKTISIAGNLGKDAVVRRTQVGDAITGFSVTVSEGREKPTTWFDCSIFGKRGEALAQYLTKGSRVAVAGDFGTREHEGRTYLQIRVDQITLLGGGQQQEPSGGQREPQGGGTGDLDDEIPFAPCVL